MARTDIPIHNHPTISSVAYGLDQLPYPGYFYVVYGHPTADGEDHILDDADTRPGMAIRTGRQCHRMDIATKLQDLRLEGIPIPAADITLIVCDLPVGAQS